MDDPKPHYPDCLLVQVYGYLAIPLDRVADVLPGLMFADSSCTSGMTTYYVKKEQSTNSIYINSIYITGEELTAGTVAKRLEDANK